MPADAWRWVRAGLVVLVAAVGGAVAVLGQPAAALGPAPWLLVGGLAALAAYLLRTRRGEPRLARAGALAAAGLWAMVLALWLLPVAATAEPCGSLLLPAERWHDRGSLCGWSAGSVHDATLPAVALAAVFAGAAAAGTLRRPGAAGAVR